MSPLQPDHVDEREVVVSVRIAAQLSTVWSFFSDADRFAAWIGAYAGGPPQAGTSVDPRIGGRIRVCYPGPSGSVSGGRITAIEPMTRVEFTWGYESGQPGIPPESTRVEIRLFEDEDGTRVELRHTGLPTPDARRSHLGGWKHYLSMLARASSDAQHSGALLETLDAYYRAWSERDESARRALLQRCCEPDVRVRTSWACTDGIDTLSAHIANSLNHMPGLSLGGAAAPTCLHGYARAAWAVKSPDGKEVFRGVNFVRLSLRGKISNVVSFAE
ncbi:MAG: SRPBCC domain-containing protein [Phycisphaerae bacterium]